MKILTLQEEIEARIERKAEFLKACAKADKKIDAEVCLTHCEMEKARKRAAWKKMMKDPKKRAANAKRQREKRKLVKMKGKTNVKKPNHSVNTVNLHYTSRNITKELRNFLDVT